MRIGIVVTQLDRRTGGMGEWTWQFVTALAERGHEIHILAQRFGEPLPPSITRYVIPATRSRVRFSVAVEALLRRLSLDVVHDMGAGWHCDIFQPHGGSHYAWLERRSAMYPQWFSMAKRVIDGILPRQRDFLRHCRQQFLAQTRDKTFVAISRTVADDFERIHRINPKQIAIVYNGVDCRRFSPSHRAIYRESVRQQLGARDESVVLLLAAHNFRLKGVPELLQVGGRLAANGRNVHVVVVGGRRLRSWQRAAARQGLAGRATFVGSTDDIVPYYAAADVYVHPTYYDPCSLVLLEAAASGLPIVTTKRHNGAAELLRDGSEILTVDNPWDADSLYERVDAMLDEHQRAQVGAAARQAALKHPFERNVDEICRLYERGLPGHLAA